MPRAAKEAVHRALPAGGGTARGRADSGRTGGRTPRDASGFGFGFPYDNAVEAGQSVLCTDGRNPAQGWSAWPSVRGPSRCEGTWVRPDLDLDLCAVRVVHLDRPGRGRLPRTVHPQGAPAPVLVVGNDWGPATNYDGAVPAADARRQRLRLLSSDSWGHTAYGTSACVTEAVNAYLIEGTLPAEGTVCTGDIQPFTEPLGSDAGSAVAERCSGAAAPAGGAAAAGCGAALLTAGCPDRAVRRPVRRLPADDPLRDREVEHPGQRP